MSVAGGACVSRSPSPNPWAAPEFQLDGMISPEAEQLALRSLQVAMPEVLARMEECGPSAIRSFSQATGAVAPQFPRLPSRGALRNKVPSRCSSAEPRPAPAPYFASRAEIVKETTELMDRRIDEVRRSWEASFSLFLTKLEPIVAAHSQRSALELAQESARESSLRARVILLEERFDALDSRMDAELLQSKVENLNSRMDVLERNYLVDSNLSQSLADRIDKLQLQAGQPTSAFTCEAHAETSTDLQSLAALVEGLRGAVAEQALKLEGVESIRPKDSSPLVEAPPAHLGLSPLPGGGLHSAWRTLAEEAVSDIKVLNDRSWQNKEVESNDSTRTRVVYPRHDEPENGLHMRNTDVPSAGKPWHAHAIGRQSPTLLTRSGPYAKVDVYELDRSVNSWRSADQSASDGISSKTVQELRRGLSQERQELEAMLRRTQKQPRLIAKRGLLSPKPSLKAEQRPLQGRTRPGREPHSAT